MLRDPGSGPDGPGVGAFFDVDNTIIRGASAFHLGVGLYRRGFFRQRDLLQFGLHQFRYLTFGENKHQIDEVRSRALSIMKGHSVAEVTAIAEDVYDEVLCLRIYPGHAAAPRPAHRRRPLRLAGHRDARGDRRR